MKDLPKVELHLHLDGSLDVNYIKDRYNLSVQEIENKMIADSKCKDLNDYLKKFDYPISILQTEEDLMNHTIVLLNKLKSQNVIYVELRFAPQLHIKGGLSQDDVVKAVIKAKNSVDLKCNLILCYMRGSDNMDLNYETLEVAKKYYNKGVCAVDLAGAEGLYKTCNYRELFKKTTEYNIPFTIHAGEADGPSSIKDAISFGASRIGHGVRVIDDLDLLNLIAEKQIPLEICPTSNIQTSVTTSYETHPVFDLYKKGVKVTINTDNMTVSNTNLEHEFNMLINTGLLTLDDVKIMIKNSIDSSFLSDKEKEELYKYIY